jgi:hypothetical protein
VSSGVDEFVMPRVQRNTKASRAASAPGGFNKKRELQNANCKLQIGRASVLSEILNLHFAICNLQFEIPHWRFSSGSDAAREAELRSTGVSKPELGNEGNDT